METELQVLISTLNQTDRHFYEKLFLRRPDKIPCIIINQIPEQSLDIEDISYSKEELDTSISWIDLKGKGLSISRNVAIKKAIGDVCVVADDDIIYLEGFKNNIINYHHLYPDHDILIFKARDPNGKPFRNYPKEIKELGIRELGGVSSIEMTFKLKRIKEKNLLFDERFGLGTEYPASEEWIFLADAMKRGLKILFIPEYIVEHPVMNSGIEYNKKRILALGASLYRVYGTQAYLRWLVFPKNIKKIHLKHHSVLPFFYFFLKGIISFQLKGSK